ncbi:MAG: c-type cytochrome, partial [Desulfobacterales bacterium]
MVDRIRWVFIVISLLLPVIFFWQIWKENHPQYLPYQEAFKDLLIQKAAGVEEIADFEFGVRQRWIRPLNRVDRCETCHLGIEDPRFDDAAQPFTSHPDVDTHPIGTLGCTICHGGWPMATTLEKSHGPTESWIKAIYHKNFMEASCSLCHGDFLQEAAPILFKGHKLFDELGCRGCHKIAGTEKINIGPPLKKIATKVKKDWLIRWLIEPKGYFENARMPNFSLDNRQAADIAAFLYSRFKPANADKEIIGSYERGRRLFGESRCVTCHSVEGRGGDIGPDLAKVSSKMKPGWLYSWVKNPSRLWSETKMPNFGFSDQEVQDIVAYITEEYIDLELEEETIIADAKRVIEGN